jgi:hypothetical protein
MNKGELEQRAVHEMRELFCLFLFLAPFLVSFAAYRIYLVGESRSLLFSYGSALLNALVLAKIILIGQIAGLGRRTESRPLIVSTLVKSLGFTALALAFHALEGLIHDLVKGHPFSEAIRTVTVMERGEMLGLGSIMFFAFIPFFLLQEIRRTLGSDRFLELTLGVKQGNRNAAGHKPIAPGDLAKQAVAPLSGN